MNSFIKCITETYNVSQKELAAMLGITSAAISQWQGAGSISIEILYKLSRLLQTSIDDLLSGILPDDASAEKQRNEFEWLRKFKIDAAVAMRDNQAVKFFNTYKKLKSRFFELMYRRVVGKLNDTWRDEFGYLSTFYTFNADTLKEYNGETDFLDFLSRNGRDKKAIIWELEQSYKCCLKVPWKACFETGDPKVYLSAYGCLNSTDKDEIVTAFRYMNFRWLPCELRKQQGRNLPEYLQNTVFEMINCGGQVRYNVGHDFSKRYGTQQKESENKLQLVSIPVIHVENTDNVSVLRVLDKWNEAEESLSAVNKNIARIKATCERAVHYDEYMKTIDSEEMSRIKNAYLAEKEETAIHNPLKYWEMVKNNQVWVAVSLN
ncbi:helix-turn-helix domain-containing protein [Pumilibacter muris]|uniref:helix-turn-helix domain-containing protein n=1 Tax=Pumilibacter muris TaxID=2941510 RepID=UPI00203B0A2A|nr:helix-turn-helix domain-containing protein [Pumilibacter muris]